MVEKNSDGTWGVTLRNKRFQFSKWGAEKSVLTFAELTKVASFGLGDAFQMLNNAKKTELVGTVLSMIARGLGEGLGTDPQQTLRLLKQFCCDSVFCDGNAMNAATFDTFFRDDILFAFELARANLEVQYNSFFVRLAPVVGLIRDELQSVIKPSTPTT